MSQCDAIAIDHSPYLSLVDEWKSDQACRTTSQLEANDGGCTLQWNSVLSMLHDVQLLFRDLCHIFASDVLSSGGPQRYSDGIVCGINLLIVISSLRASLLTTGLAEEQAEKRWCLLVK